MIWFVRDFDLLSVLLRALSFALEALALGGVVFLTVAARPAKLDVEAQRRLRRMAARSALGLAMVQVLLLATTSAVLISSAGLSVRELISAAYFVAGSILAASTLALFFLLRARVGMGLLVFAGLVALGASVSLSHAASRMEHRPLLLLLTAAHHLGMAAWMGGLPSLLVALQWAGEPKAARVMARRFSRTAIASVLTLVLAGLGLSWFYVGSWQGLYGTSYGILLAAKIVLTLAMIALGAGNYYVVRGMESNPRPLLARLRRLGEAELGLGFTVILAAASLTAQSPAADEAAQSTLSRHDVAARIAWRWPSFHTPAVSELAPPTPLGVAVREATYTGGSVSDASDRAWSEYNHHWAGLIVLAAGGLALASRVRGQGWARHWPLLFLGLSIFILLRADPECWPLGPRPFWASFTAPDVLEHRAYAVLIAAFALFEWGVETGGLRLPPARLIFPALCAAGGALLLTHTHALGEGKDEVFAELSHTPIALLGAAAGWGRWIEVRGAGGEETRVGRAAAWIWPGCLMLIGLLLLNYRES